MGIVSPTASRLALFGLAFVLVLALTLVSGVLTRSSGAWRDTVGLSTTDTALARIITADQALMRGEAILLAQFGRTVVDEERPLVAQLQGAVWTVSGTLPPHSVGGVGTVQRGARDGHVIRVSHLF